MGSDIIAMSVEMHYRKQQIFRNRMIFKIYDEFNIKIVKIK